MYHCRVFPYFHNNIVTSFDLLLLIIASGFDTNYTLLSVLVPVVINSWFDTFSAQRLRLNLLRIIALTFNSLYIFLKFLFQFSHHHHHRRHHRHHHHHHHHHHYHHQHV